MRAASWALLVATLLCACEPEARTLVVDLRTDLVPGVEVDAIEVRVDEDAPRAIAAEIGDDFVGGARVAEAEVLPGSHVVTATLTRGGETVVEQSIRVQVSGPTSVTVLVTRDCRGVECPAADATATACLGGVCVDPACTPETPERCPPPACAEDSDCLVEAPCATGRCVGGACLSAPERVCGGGLYCDPDSDCAPLPASCPLWGPFGEPTPVTELNGTGQDWAAWLSPDRLRVYFASERPGGMGAQDLYLAERPSPEAPFGAPTPIVELNTALDDSDPHLSPDERTIYWHAGSAPTELYVARRADATGPFGAPERLAISDPTFSDINPAVSADGLELYYARDGGASGFELFVATRSSAAEPFAAGAVIESLSSPNLECCPSPSADGLSLFYETRTATSELWVATRASRGEPYGPGSPIADLARPDDDGDPYLSFDGTQLWFSSQRPGGLGLYDIWVSERACVR